MPPQMPAPSKPDPLLFQTAGLPSGEIPAKQGRPKRKWRILGGIQFGRLIAIIASVCVVAALLSNRAFSQDGELSGGEAAQVKARVQKIRGLRLTSDVPVSYLSVAETEARFRTEFAKQTTQEDID